MTRLPKEQNPSFVSRVWYRLETFFGRSSADEALNDEVEFHLHMLTQQHIDQGLTPDQARRKARKVFGRTEQIKEELRDGFGFPRLEDFWFDSKVALRGLRKAPLFTLGVVVTLALGIGASSTIFSAVNEVLLRPLPYPDAEELVFVYARNKERGYDGSNVSYPNFLSWKEQTEELEGLAIYTWSSATLGTGIEAEIASGALLSANALDVLGVQPVLGQGFTEADTAAGAPPTILLGFDLWQRKFGGAEDLVGTTILVDGAPTTVAGIMPKGFRFPTGEEIWKPMVPHEYHQMRNARFLASAVGRLGDDADLASAQTEFDAISQTLATEFPDSNEGWDASLVPVRDSVVGPIGNSLKILQVAVLVLLLVICANVGGLILSRTLARAPEFSLRQVLGASRRRLLIQISTESAVLGGLSGAVALAILVASSSKLQSMMATRVPLADEFYVRPATLVFLGLLVVCSTVLLTAIPFFGLPRGDRTKPSSRRALGSGSRTFSSGLSRLGRSTFVVAELCLVTLLLLGSVLLVRTLHSMERIDAGFDREVLTANVRFNSEEYPNEASRINAANQLIEELAALPGVAAVGGAQGMPYSGWNIHQQYQVTGEPPPVQGQELDAHLQAVHSDFFEAIGVPLVAGRLLRVDDPSAVIVNESFVRRHFSGQSGEAGTNSSRALGQQVSVNREIQTIVGVVGDYRHFSLFDEMKPAIYMPWSALASTRLSIALRPRSGGPTSLIPDLRRTVANVLPNTPPSQIQTLGEALRRQGDNSRLVRDLLATFAVLAALLAMLGLYAIVAYTVQHRRREFGLRIALGATPQAVTRRVVSQGLGLASIGILLGVAVGLGLSRTLSSVLFGVAPNDPVTFVVVSCLTLVLAGVATWVPARKAGLDDPLKALRAE